MSARERCIDSAFGSSRKFSREKGVLHSDSNPTLHSMRLQTRRFHSAKISMNYMRPRCYLYCDCSVRIIMYSSFA